MKNNFMMLSVVCLTLGLMSAPARAESCLAALTLSDAGEIQVTLCDGQVLSLTDTLVQEHRLGSLRDKVLSRPERIPVTGVVVDIWGVKEKKQEVPDTFLTKKEWAMLLTQGKVDLENRGIVQQNRPAFYLENQKKLVMNYIHRKRNPLPPLQLSTPVQEVDVVSSIPANAEPVAGEQQNTVQRRNQKAAQKRNVVLRNKNQANPLTNPFAAIAQQNRVQQNRAQQNNPGAPKKKIFTILKPVQQPVQQASYPQLSFPEPLHFLTGGSALDMNPFLLPQPTDLVSLAQSVKSMQQALGSFSQMIHAQFFAQNAFTPQPSAERNSEQVATQSRAQQPSAGMPGANCQKDGVGCLKCTQTFADFDLLFEHMKKQHNY